MSTPAQIAANTANAKLSPGPTSEAGKAVSSQNGVTLGLFTASDFVRPSDQTAYAELNAELLHDLAPVGILERNLVDEIRCAMWRLRRCGEVESHLVIGLDNGSGFIFDPMETDNAGAEKVQRSVDRARAQAHRLLHKSTAELRRLQTERRYAKEFFSADADPSSIGIADCRVIVKAHNDRTRIELHRKKTDHRDSTLSLVTKSPEEMSAPGDLTNRTQSGDQKAA